MEIPSYPESYHPLIQSLYHHSDEQLLTMFQEYPEQGKYFTTIFCRYSAIVYTLIFDSVGDFQVTNYLFARTWVDIFYEMRGLILSSEGEPELTSLQNWLIYITSLSINEKQNKLGETIPSEFKNVSIPLLCYLEQALEVLPPMIRFILVMIEKFRWSKNRVAAYLQAEGEMITKEELEKWLNRGHQLIESAIPEDIKIIYLDGEAKAKLKDNEKDYGWDFEFS